jgi:hypothetical protein
MRDLTTGCAQPFFCAATAKPMFMTEQEALRLLEILRTPAATPAERELAANRLAALLHELLSGF